MIFIIVHRLSGAISPRLCNSSVKALRSSVHTVAGGARNWRVRPYATCDTADMTSSSVLAEYVFPREGERVSTKHVTEFLFFENFCWGLLTQRV